MSTCKINALWTIQEYEEEEPKAFMTRIRWIAREAFRKLLRMNNKLAVHAFCDGLQDHGMDALVAPQSRNSAVIAVRMGSEAMAIRRTTESREDIGSRSSDNEAIPAEEEEAGVSLIGHQMEGRRGSLGEKNES